MATWGVFSGRHFFLRVKIEPRLYPWHKNQSICRKGYISLSAPLAEAVSCVFCCFASSGDFRPLLRGPKKWAIFKKAARLKRNVWVIIGLTRGPMRLLKYNLWASSYTATILLMSRKELSLNKCHIRNHFIRRELISVFPNSNELSQITHRHCLILWGIITNSCRL